MKIFDWETSAKAFFAQLPQDNIVFRFMHFISYPGSWGWLMWICFFLYVFRMTLRVAIQPIPLGVLAAGLGDLFSRRVFKVFFMRPRPWSSVEACFDAHCWGFVSSHCTNITAFVTVLILHNRKNLAWGLPAVVLVSISRMYIGDHYALDVFGGDILGFMIGSFVWQVYWLIRRWRESSDDLQKKKAIKQSAFRLFGIVAAALFFSTITYMSIVRITENFYEVDPGKFYRSAQLDPIELNDKIERYDIKTVISLLRSPENSYRHETQEKLLKKKDVQFKSYWLDTNSYPTKDELPGILKDFESAPKPILIHCRSGADRTALISALYVFDEMKKAKDEALKQLGPKYWHFEKFHLAMNSFVKEYGGREGALSYDERKYPDYSDCKKKKK